DEFRDDVIRSKKVLEDMGGQAVLGYRAPSFSIGRHNLWALDVLEEAGYAWQIASSEPARSAAEYADKVLAYVHNTPIRLRDVAMVSDSVQDLRNYGASNGKPAIVLLIRKQPGANVIETVQRVRALLPRLQASIPQAIDLEVISDRTPTIRASLREVERTLLMAVGLVILVVLLFLRSWRATLIPAVAVPVSLAGSVAAMYLLGYSLNNLSIMALTVATGFVVDDAIVVLENISRHIERGLSPRAAALKGAGEMAFTVLSISLSLVAVFVPLLFMGGIVGRLFREFSVVLSVSIMVSMLVSLTTTPMMAAHLLAPRAAPKLPNSPPRARAAWLSVWLSAWLCVARRVISRVDLVRAQRAVMRAYQRSLLWSLRHPLWVLSLLLGVIGLNVYLYVTIPKTFFPQQDTGILIGNVQADQDSSFALMQQRLDSFMTIIRRDPAVANVSGSTGGNQGNAGNSANMFVTLKALSERRVSADAVVARLRPALATVPGASVALVPVQDIRIGGRQSNAQYQYSLQADDLAVLRSWAPRVRNALAQLPELVDVSSDQQDKGMQTSLLIERDAIARLGISMNSIDSTLNNAFGQRQVGVIYNPFNQYRVVMELAPEYLQDPASLQNLYVTNQTGQQVPLAAFARVEMTNSPLSVNHQSGSPATTISFNLPPGVSLSQATSAIEQSIAKLGLPVSVHGRFQGTASAFAQSLASQPWLIAAALIAIYLVLGILYESLVHPVTILSTLPSAGVGALLGLILFNSAFSVIALIGIILLIGMVKKNAIMMIDFAIVRQRAGVRSSAVAIFRAARLRFRPILMTTLAAIAGAIPLILGSGDGAELRQPLGIAIVGGLLFSQLLTLYTTPVVFVLMDRLSWRKRS
ncbi:MAG: efflux RND transporter permease subunit, partial [Pseudomonadota bacterium]